MLFQRLKKLTVTLCVFFTFFAFPAVVHAEELVFICSDSNMPYHIIEDDGVSGFEIEVLNTIFNTEKYSVSYINEKDIQSDVMYGSMIFFGSGKTPKSDNYTASDLVYYSQYAAFSLEENRTASDMLDFTDLRKMRVGCIKGSYPDIYLSDNSTGCIYYDNTNQLALALENGDIDIAFSNIQSFSYVAAMDEISSTLYYHDEFLSVEETCLWIPSDNTELLDFVNMRLDNIHESGRLEEIYRQNFMEQSLRDTLESARERSMQVAVTAVVVCIVIGSIIISSVLNVLESRRFSSNLAKGILNYGNRFVVIWKEDFSYYEVNDFFREVFGIEKGSDISSIADILNVKKEIIENGENPEDVEKLFLKHNIVITAKGIDGSKHDIIWTSIVLDEKKSVKTILSIGSDTTEKNRLRRELRESDRRYETVLESTGIAYMNISDNKTVTYMSSYAYTLLGIDASYGTPGLEMIIGRIYNKDREKFDILIDRSRVSKDFIERDIRVLNSNGTYRWFAFKFKSIESSDDGESHVAVLFFDNSAEKEKDMRSERLAFYDDLTGIYNRRKFLATIEDRITNSKHETRFAVLAFNIDKFNRFNDLYGVEAGDNILRLVARTLKMNPLGNDFTCARLGNDEFACLIRLLGNEDLSGYVNSFTEKIRELIVLECDDVKFTISAGACIYPDSAANYTELYERAIYSMRVAKNTPNISFKCHDEGVTKQVLQRERLEKDVYEAVKHKQFELYYQPKVDIETREIVGAEALIRWNHPEKGVIGPVEFISVAEDIGVIGEIGRWTIENACRKNKEWQNQGLKNIKVSVNISAVEFYQSDIVSTVKHSLDATGLEPKWLEIELTESMAMLDIDATIMKMNALRELGVGISMDDFGTGYSSLSYMQNLPIDELKLDKSFISKINKDVTTKNITSAVINLARKIGLVVVAEGVEQWEQFDLLKEMNCNIIQGYLFAKPLKTEDFEKKIKDDALMRLS